jgi:osmotically inducible protein OsmC
LQTISADTAVANETALRLSRAAAASLAVLFTVISSYGSRDRNARRWLWFQSLAGPADGACIRVSIRLCREQRAARQTLLAADRSSLTQPQEVSMIRKAKAVWRGTGRDGDGDLSTDSGVLDQTPYSYRTRFENEKGTNPEELIAAAHAGCFTMALAFQLQTAGYTPTELATEAAVSLESEGQGFTITRSALTLRASVPTLDEATFMRLAEAAEKNCPVSKVLRAEITLDAKLA